jgi:hypothetical protein
MAVNLVGVHGMLDATKRVMATHSRYQRRAHQKPRRPHSDLATTALVSAHAVDAADRVALTVQDNRARLFDRLPQQVPSAARFRASRNKFVQTFDRDSWPRWMLDKVRHPGDAGQLPSTPDDLVGRATACSEAFRNVIDQTRHLGRKNKKSERSKARARLAAHLCGINHAVLACIDENEDHVTIAATALSGPL